MLRSQGNLSEASAAYGAALEVRERLSSQDPGNAGWQRDLAVSYYKLADFHQNAGDPAQAREHLVQCRDVLRGMRSRGMHLDPAAASLLERLERES